MIEPTQIDWAKLAAYIDGEGSICVQRYRQLKRGVTKNWTLTRHRMTVQVANTDLRLMQWLVERFSGAITKKNCAGRHKSKRDLYQWTAYQGDIEKILRNCLEHFVIKRDRAEIALLYRKFFGKTWNSLRIPEDVLEKREECRTKLRVLNGRAIAA